MQDETNPVIVPNKRICGNCKQGEPHRYNSQRLICNCEFLVGPLWLHETIENAKEEYACNIVEANEDATYCMCFEQKEE